MIRRCANGAAASAAPPRLFFDPATQRGHDRRGVGGGGQLPAFNDLETHGKEFNANRVHPWSRGAEQRRAGAGEGVNEPARLQSQSVENIINEGSREAFSVLEPAVAVLALVRLKADERSVQVPIDDQLRLEPMAQFLFAPPNGFQVRHSRTLSARQLEMDPIPPASEPSLRFHRPTANTWPPLQSVSIDTVWILRGLVRSRKRSRRCLWVQWLLTPDRGEGRIEGRSIRAAKELL